MGYQFLPNLSITNRPWWVIADFLRQSVLGQVGVRRSLIFRVRPHRIFGRFCEVALARNFIKFYVNWKTNKLIGDRCKTAAEEMRIE